MLIRARVRDYRLARLARTVEAVTLRVILLELAALVIGWAVNR